MNNETFYFIYPADSSDKSYLAQRVIRKAKEHYTNVVAMGSEIRRIYDRVLYWKNRECIERPKAKAPQVSMTHEGDTIIIHVNKWTMRCIVITDFLFNEKGEHVNV